MIDFYCVPTANGQKIAILLEELKAPYEMHLISRRAGDLPDDDYLKISPLGKYPAIVDHDCSEKESVNVFETHAIALYCSEKYGQLIPEDKISRAYAHAWASVASAGLTPVMATQYFLTLRAASNVSEATLWVENEAHRCLRALNFRLGESKFLAGEIISYADILTYPLIATSVKRLSEGTGLYKNLSRWFEMLSSRASFKKGLLASGA